MSPEDSQCTSCGWINPMRWTCLILIAVFGVIPNRSQADLEFRNDQLVYAIDDRGNRIPDFSYAGYRSGEVPIPTIIPRVYLQPIDGDNTSSIQAAIDLVAQRTPDQDGFRGAILLSSGSFRVQGTLRIHTSGVVLRGSGCGENGTRLLADGIERRTLIEIGGETLRTVGEPREIQEAYLPVNATVLTLSNTEGLSVGDTIRITHPCTKEWIIQLGMDDFGGDRHGPSWRPGSRDIHWIRQVTEIRGPRVTLDAPLTLALDASLAKGTLTKVDASLWVRHVGVENLQILSSYDPDNPHDEEHAWFGVGIQNGWDAWVRRVTFQHLVGSAVAVWNNSRRVTVEDCKSLRPISEIGGLRRNTFFVAGQQVLMQRLYSQRGIHDFSVGLAAAGPNAFVQCESSESFGESGPIDSAACGTLFDRVRIDNHGISLRNFGSRGQGTGWASFNGVLWNCSAALISNERPPMAKNWSFGSHGEYNGNGLWFNSDDPVDPASLYYAQLEARIGKEAARSRALLNLPKVQGSRAPTIEKAAEATEVSKHPRMTMSQWIDEVIARYDVAGIDQDPLGLRKRAESLASQKPEASKKVDDRSEDSLALSPEDRGWKRLEMVNGWLAIDGRLAIGSEASVPWWNGSVRPDSLAQAQPALTRFVPGRNGLGLTDDLNQVVETMVQRGQRSVWQQPPLWYDRRRDDHTRVQRMDGDVVAPFYETPWARSGQGRASDGLSKWDLTKTNPWYFGRLRQFARKGAQQGLILMNGLYMQHSILEAGAHYADAPWRPANSIHDLGIPEPVFFAGDKLIYVAEQFYDVKNPKRAALHKTYMTKALNELADQPNVLFFLSDEYTGPLEFVQFWLQVVSEWKSSTGKVPSIALYATKDVTDAILQDPVHSESVTLIYNRSSGDGWWYQPDGTLYAPQGGKNLAPRQWARLLKPKSAGFREIHRAVVEYRQKFPTKPFVYQASPHLAWASLLGGGSLPDLPKTTDPQLLSAILQMRPLENAIGLADDLGNKLLYSETPILGEGIQAIDMALGQVTQQSSKLYWVQAK